VTFVRDSHFHKLQSHAVWIYLRRNFYGGLRKTVLFLQECRFGRSRSSKIIDFCTNRKRVCDFLLVCHSNLGHILPRFGDIAGFCAPDPTLFHPNFGGCYPYVGQDRRCWDQREQVPYAIRLWNYFRSIPTYVITVPERYRRTDGQTDDILWHSRVLRSIAWYKANTCYTLI